MISTSSFGLLMSILAIVFTRIQATCTCKEVCPSYDGHWERRKACPANSFEFCTKYIPNPWGGPMICDNWEPRRAGGCACNVFGCNCDGCGCKSNQRNLRATSTGYAGPAKAKGASGDACADYAYYMAMSPDERRNYLRSKYCGTDPAAEDAPDAREFLEGQADMNGDGALDCDEFNLAYMEVDRSDICGTERETKQ